ncbi:MAG: hypothetical protein HYZ28_16240 [Myxococcales bacterium]|nr:hypothetical protein [Myxococcales bacterium]
MPPRKSPPPDPNVDGLPPGEGLPNLPEGIPPEELERLLGAAPLPEPALPAGFPEGLPPGVPTDLDTYEDSKRHDVKRDTSTEVAPEVSHVWRERAFAPRGVVPREEILTQLDRALRVASAAKAPPEKVWVALKGEWMPFLRQAVEQAAGDGLDAYLAHVIDGKPPPKGMLLELALGMERTGQADHTQAIVAEGRKVIEAVRSALNSAAAKKISLKGIERHLDSRVDLGDVLQILFESDAELEKRLGHTDRTLESLRAQLKEMPGGQPEGMLSAFARLKVETRLIEAEQRRRGPRG